MPVRQELAVSIRSTTRAAQRIPLVKIEAVLGHGPGSHRRVDAAGDRSDGAEGVLDDAAGVDVVDVGTIDMTTDGGPMAYDAGLMPI
jgi:hypothetical protein